MKFLPAFNTFLCVVFRYLNPDMVHFESIKVQLLVPEDEREEGDENECFWHPTDNIENLDLEKVIFEHEFCKSKSITFKKS